MKTEAFEKFLAYFDTSGHERLDGLDASYFEKMDEEEKSKAFEILRHRLHQGSEEAIKGLILVSKQHALSELIDRYTYLKTERMINRQLMTLAYYLYLNTQDDNYQKDIAYFFLDKNRIVKLKALNYIKQTKKTLDIIAALEEVVVREKDSTVSFVAAKQLLEGYGIIEGDPITGKIFEDNINRFFSDDFSERKSAVNWLKACHTLQIDY